MNDDLKSFVDRINNLEAEKAEVSEGLSDLFKEAKGAGFDPKVLKTVAKIVRDDAAKEFADATGEIEVYLSKLGYKMPDA